MQQRINLYPLLPKKAKKRFTWGMLYFLYGIFILLLIVKWMNVEWSKNQLTKEYARELVLLTEEHKKFDLLTAQYPSVDTKNIRTIADKLRAELDNELKIIKLLEKSSTFSSYLQGLAETSVPSVWLTEIAFSADEPHIVLKGNALKPFSTQQFLDQLVHRPVFVNVPFKISELTQSSLENNTIFIFSMTTKTKNLI